MGLFAVVARIAHPLAQFTATSPTAPLKVPQPPSSGDLIQAFTNAIEGHTGRVDIEYRESGDEGSIHSRTHDNEDGSIIPVPLYETVGKIGS